MTKRTARLLSILAFAALLMPCGRALSLADALWALAMGGRLYATPYTRLLGLVHQSLGPAAAQWAHILCGWLVAAIPAVLLYRYLVRRDFNRVCADCAAHKVGTGVLFVLFLLFSFFSPTTLISHLSASADELPLAEEKARHPAVSLELCLCHADSDRLTRTLTSTGRSMEEALSSAAPVEGYRLMPVMRNGHIFELVYVSETAELTAADVQGASARKATVGDGYEVEGHLTPEGSRKLHALTRDYQPGGRKNPTDEGRRLAIVVDGELVMAPRIVCEIGEVFMIAGALTRDEAIRLAAALDKSDDGAAAP